MDIIKKVHHYLSSEMKEMNEIIVSSLTAEEELIKAVGSHLSNSGGKRIRPLLTLLSAKACGYESGQQAYKLAAAIEFIHMATLLHDDVVDESTMRRFLPTANSIWGNKASILVGDFLFSQSFKLMVNTKNIRALEILSNACAIISEGEVSQLNKLEQKTMLSIDQYYDLIKAKTAELLACACEVGAIIANKMELAEGLRTFGMNFGIAFQISDDNIDYFSTSEKAGKNIGDDFFEGKVTLPLIILHSEMNNKDSEKLTFMLKSEKRKSEDLQWVQNKMLEYKIPNLVGVHLKETRQKALKALASVEDKLSQSAVQHLTNLLEFAVERTY